MAATLSNSIPFFFAIFDAVALFTVLAFIVRGLLLAVLGRPGWKTVLIITSSYVIWANALMSLGLTAFNPGAYLIGVAAVAWNDVTRLGTAEALLAGLPLRLLVSWVVVSAAPTLVLAVVELAAQRRVW